MAPPLQKNSDTGKAVNVIWQSDSVIPGRKTRKPGHPGVGEKHRLLLLLDPQVQRTQLKITLRGERRTRTTPTYSTNYVMDTMEKLLD